jgi:hypothetical protein
MKHWAAFGLLLSGITLWLPSNAGAEQGPPWTDAQCGARWNQLIGMMGRASDPKASDAKANLSELKTAMEELPSSSFGKACLKEARSLQQLMHWAEVIETGRQEIAGADSTTDRAGKQLEEASKDNPDASFINFEKK